LPSGERLRLRVPASDMQVKNMRINKRSMRTQKYFLVAASLVAMFFSTTVAAENMRELVKSGFKVLYQGTMEFDGCDHDKAYVIGPYIAVCEEYGYSYSYGDVLIMIKTLRYQGRQVNLFYLCPDDDDECYQISLRRR
jgi:hypothetical protein